MFFTGVISWDSTVLLSRVVDLAGIPDIYADGDSDTPL